MLTAIALTWALAQSGWALDGAIQAENYSTPTKLLNSGNFPLFADDLDLQGFELAAARQLERFKIKDLSGEINLGGKNYPLIKARTSLEVFLQLAGAYKACKNSYSTNHCVNILNNEIRARYNVFIPDLKPGDPHYQEPFNSLFTGYASQPITGKSQKDAVNSHAVYAQPQVASDRIKTRDEIDFHDGLKGKGLELLYAPNLYDLYLLHIEGGGYITLDQGGTTTNFYLSYNGTNNQPFGWISKYMLSKGYIANLSSGAQRKFLRLHPEKQEEIFAQCPSYVFFKVTTTPPEGVEGIPVSPGRTVATDNKLYAFKGLLTFIESQRPRDTGTYDLEEEDVNKIPFDAFSRFVIDQDTGGAITGKGRADIYFGIDQYAQYAATYQAEQGNIYFLLLK